ncbi:transporter substrate-binding domain-containing protein, partial [Pseudooceanicola sp. CBS1P-1]|uniref:transporter substrate-binding domain-containing protein n=1 Tax=Pseudooceanicola endophyticus TaxID=2841273 RepID=UPI001C014837
MIKVALPPQLRRFVRRNADPGCRRRPGIFAVLAGLFLALALPSGAQAQAPVDAEALRVPWTDSAGLGFVSDAGEVRSFAADLARMIAGEAGLALRFERYDTPGQLIEAIGDGRSDLAFIADLPPLRARNLALAPVAEVQLLLYVRQSEPAEVTLAGMGGRRIGVMQGTAGARLALPEGARRVVFDDQIVAFAQLLAGRVDGVLMAHTFAERTLRLSGISGLVRPVFPPAQVVVQHLLLNRDRAALAPRIEAALTRLEASGAMTDLRTRWSMVPPVPIPEVLTVGVQPFPPYQVVRPDGSVTGFSVETLKALAARSDLKLRFKVVTPEDWLRGPRPGSFDLLPARSITREEIQWMQFSLPVQTIEYAVFVPAARAGLGLDPGRMRIGILATSPIRSEVARDLGRALLPVADAAAGVEALRSGRLDAVIFPAVSFEDYLSGRGEAGQVHRLAAPVFRGELAIAMRAGLGDLKARLNVVIPGFLGSLEYQTLVRRWFDDPPFWTRARVHGALAMGGALALLGALAFLAQTWRARRQEARLRAETTAVSDRLAAILASTRQAIFGFDSAGGIAVINPSGRQLLSLPEGAVPRRWPPRAVFLDPLSAEALPPGEDPLDRLSRDVLLRGAVYLFRADPGAEPHYVRVSIDRVTDPHSALAHVLILEDDDENELTRQKLIRAQRLSSMGLLTGGLAHDFNNILATILYNAQLARLTAEGPGATVLDRIIASVEQGSALTRRLLGFARRRAQAGGAVRLADSLREVEALAAPAIGAALRLEVALPEEDLFLGCDGGELENALLNLVLNARDAIQQAGQGDRIRIAVRCRDLDAGDGAGQPRPMAEIAVSDNGPGMTEEVRRRAADPFFSTKVASGGSGLGLAMVESFVTRAAGRFLIYSEPGEGTTVRLCLPRVSAEGGALAPVPPDAVPLGRGARILLVEDNAELREPMADLLRDIGYVVETAPSAVVARARLEAGRLPDLVLSDIVLPGGLSGVALAQEVRRRHPGLPIVLITGFAEYDAAQVQALAVPVLSKPCPLPELARAIRG